MCAAQKYVLVPASWTSASQTSTAASRKHASTALNGNVETVFDVGATSQAPHSRESKEANPEFVTGTATTSDGEIGQIVPAAPTNQYAQGLSDDQINTIVGLVPKANRLRVRMFLVSYSQQS